MTIRVEFYHVDRGPHVQWEWGPWGTEGATPPVPRVGEHVTTGQGNQWTVVEVAYRMISSPGRREIVADVWCKDRPPGRRPGVTYRAKEPLPRVMDLGQRITEEINSDPEEVVQLNRARQSARLGNTVPLAEALASIDTDKEDNMPFF